MQTIAATSVDGEVTFELSREHRQRLIAELEPSSPWSSASAGRAR
jgi:hypothetical protein